jgi:hypothetical protein
VGDDPRWDVSGAEEAGIRPLLLAPNGSGTTPPNIAIVRNLREVLDHMKAQV